MMKSTLDLHDVCGILQDKLVDKIEDFLETLDISLSRNDRMLYGSCPIHNGDNPQAFNLFLDGEHAKLNWVCYTRSCQLEGNTIFHLVAKKRGISFKDAVKVVADYLGVDLKNIKHESKPQIIYDSIQHDKIFNLKKKPDKLGISREVVRRNLEIPAQYFINRGFKPETLEFFDVGLCTKENKQMFNRVVVPVYDSDNDYVGCTGRSIFEKCPICLHYHNPMDLCPITNIEKCRSHKWVASKDFDKSFFLYNFNNSQKYILDQETVIIVEGPGDVWKLHEAEIYNTVGLMGATITNEQLNLIHSCGAFNIITLLDNDDAGTQCRKYIDKFNTLYRIKHLVPTAKDVGEMTVQEIMEKKCKLKF